VNDYSGTRVLIAEDNYMVGEMVKALLEEIGYTVAGEASDGLEAVELTQLLSPDVVLMDIQMPDMDGIEAVRLIQACCPTPVVMLTAYETPELVKEASTAGVSAYLVKPPSAREIERTITIAVDRFQDMLELRRLNRELQAALEEVKVLSGLLPICMTCKKIRDDEGYWHQVEEYIEARSKAEFSHGLCPSCARDMYPEFFRDDE
jgi:AmiR/NasT family two-component response regulator